MTKAFSLALLYLAAFTIGYGLGEIRRFLVSPAPSPTPHGTAYLVDCNGGRFALGQYIGAPQLTPSGSTWKDSNGKTFSTRGFVLFVGK